MEPRPTDAGQHVGAAAPRASGVGEPVLAQVGAGTLRG